MNRLPPASILDAPEFRFPVEHPDTGVPLKPVWRWQGDRPVRCRMRDLKAGDLFAVQSSDEDENNIWHVADTDAWFLPGRQDWGVTAMPYDPEADDG